MRTNLLVLALALGAAVAQASVVIPGAPADPVPDTFGALPAATFGGTGIPNNAVAISTWGNGVNRITLGITATPRFAGTVANDGMGNFTAAAGTSPFAPSPTDPYANWNFSFYIDVAGAPGVFGFAINYDMDGTVGTAIVNHGTLGVVAVAPITLQGSYNLGMNFLAVAAPGVTPPSPLPTFDPNANGEYTFAISAYSGSTLLDTVSMRVSAVPEVSAPLAFATVSALVGIGAVVRKRWLAA